MTAISNDAPRRSSTEIILLCNERVIGGAQRDASMLSMEFTRRGYTSTIGFLLGGPPEGHYEFPQHFVAAERRPQSLYDWRNLIAACNREIVMRRPKAIIGVQPFANIVGAIAAQAVDSCAMVASQHNPSDRQSPWIRRIEKMVGSTRLYSANIAVSEAVARSFDRYPKHYRSKLRIVHNAKPELVATTASRRECREALGIPPAGIVLGCIGRLHRQKNLSFALEVTRRLPEARLVIAGSGPEEAALRQMAGALGIGERVAFMGSLSGVDVTRFYRAVDAVLFCSVYEGFGLVLLEAMSQGTPVVANDLDVTREVGREALHYVSLDPEKWIHAIQAAVSPGPHRESLIAAGRRRADEFSLDRMVDGYLDAANLWPSP